ncbi:MAG: hypothetical protein KBG48_18685 [Kofleriaceae bacterium]|jgi:hypothetical protein|nr:hypothetical protein [Kofleriaceae bacterium]MBP9169434.1 hypothetical protein [Kofleriaceae bacterium]MBP9862508.1 hypothetical protein [Kofleriaceae bacterium]
MRSSWVAALAAVALGCGGPRAAGPRPPSATQVPTPQVKVGECATPERDGVMSATPARQRHDTDLDGDGEPEVVIADRALCQGDNCHWNVFVADGAAGCQRFAGTLAGTALERGPAAPGQFAPVRAYWHLGGDRVLLHDYQFRRGGYQLVEVILCRRRGDDRLACAEPDASGR